MFKRILLAGLLVGLISTPAFATVSGDVKVSTNTTEESSLDLGTGRLPVSHTASVALSTSDIDLQFTDTRTLAASGNEELDLAGSLTDAFGNTITFARVACVIVQAHSANTNNVVVGGSATNGFINWVSDATDEIVVRPGGFFALCSDDATGYPVTATTGDLLDITNSAGGTSVTYTIILLGKSS